MLERNGKTYFLIKQHVVCWLITY